MTIPNPELQLANEFVLHSNRNIFLTGKAGTGKTTFLHNLKNTLPKRMIVTAPTGVAAINAGGVTLHSFFQMPFVPFLPGSEAHSQSTQRKFSKEKINIIRSLDLLVIDEISMVRADLLDGVDSVLRRYKNPNQAFGGVQLLMIGDLHQLSPVVRKEEWELLRPYYDSCYFFSSNALKKTDWVPIELKHIYRQSDSHFIDLLNKVRNNHLDYDTLKTLNSRYDPDFEPGENEDYITLCTHNANANETNSSQLDKLAAKSFTFRAIIEDDYPEYIYPTAERLVLKEGAQVMFVRNDNSVNKCYYNGKIGKITRVDAHKINVKCAQDKQEIEVDKVSWENIKYSINPKSKQIEEQIIGKFTQFPLRLAWAITVHKSQGLTFERAIIDANAAFAHGQVYVALSRCKTFEGIVLSTPIALKSIKTDMTVAQFTAEVGQTPTTHDLLNRAKIAYQKELLHECFDFGDLRSNLDTLATVLLENQDIVVFTGGDSIESVKKQMLDEIDSVGKKFRKQLDRISNNDTIPQDDPYLQERVRKASLYFSQKLQSGLGLWIQHCTFETDNREIRLKIQQAYDVIQRGLSIKTAALHCCKDGFSSNVYLQRVAKAQLDFDSAVPIKRPTSVPVAPNLEHAELYRTLKQWRTEQAGNQEVDEYRIIHQKVLAQIAVELPNSLKALVKINGIGKRTAEKYGEQLTNLVEQYAREHSIKLQTPPSELSVSSQKSKKASVKKLERNTKQISYELYLEGNDIHKIAELRDLVPSTIENHLAHYVGTGELQLSNFVDDDKFKRIQEMFSEKGDQNLKAIKYELGDECTYGEIRMVQKYLTYLNSRSGTEIIK